MISKQLLLALAIGATAMLFPIMVQAKWYKIKLWKCFVITVVLTVVGTVGTYLLFYLENSRWGGTSFYGAVFFVPVVFLLFCKLINIPYGKLMNLCAPAECVMLAIMKTRCLTAGCCSGRTLFVTADGVEVVFPSQLVELLAALVLGGILLVLSKKDKYKAIGYPMYLILYGCVRFALNILRDEWVTTDMVLPYGNIWSLVAIAVGGLWIFLVNYTKKRKPAETD
ncbi:MAG: hypothetical protein E7618_03205 [Ruminococcaceae bacterium]|nr:hypothetical protein [Oscillospiraceae bacterium]